MDALIISSPPGGAAKSLRCVSSRPEVQALPELSAVMSRWPLPSRWTLLAEPVIVSTSPVPQLAAPLAEVVPVRVIQLAEDGAEPADPAKLSLHTGVQPGGVMPPVPVKTWNSYRE